MPFSPKNWQDSPSTATPITAVALEDLETRVTDYSDEVVEAVQLGQAFAFGPGIDPTGTTSSTTALQALIDGLAVAGGGVLQFPPGTFLCNLTIKPRVRLVGAGMKVTTLKAVASSNAEVVKGLDFATLTGKSYETGDVNLGAYEVELTNLTLDGNKANQTSGWVCRIWGRATRIQKVEIVDGNDGGLWTEFTEVDDFRDPTEVAEGVFDHVSIHACGGTGWNCRGPHDSHCGGQLAIWDCTGRSLVVSTAIFIDLLDTYMCAQGVLVEDGGSLHITDAQIATDAEEFRVGTVGHVGLEFQASTGVSRVRATFDGWRELGVSGQPGVAGNDGVAVLLRGDDHDLDLEIKGCDTGIVFDGAAGYNVHCTFQANGYLYKNISENRPGRFSGSGDLASGQALKDPASAAWNSRSRISLSGTGAGGNLYEEHLVGNKLTHSGGWTPQLPTTTGTLLHDGNTGLTYGPAIAIDASLGIFYTIQVTNATAFTINTPTNPIGGRPMTITIVNSSGGAMGAITWTGAAFHLDGAFTGPANGKYKNISFVYQFGIWLETGRTGDLG